MLGLDCFRPRGDEKSFSPKSSGARSPSLLLLQTRKRVEPAEDPEPLTLHTEVVLVIPCDQPSRPQCGDEAGADLKQQFLQNRDNLGRQENLAGKPKKGRKTDVLRPIQPWIQQISRTQSELVLSSFFSSNSQKKGFC